MFDDVPGQVWLMIFYAAAAYAPARYVVRYIVNSPDRHDITQPPEDWEWRTPRKLAECLAILAGLAAFSILIVTPAAERLFTSAVERLFGNDVIVPALMAAMGGGALFTVVRGVKTGRIYPLVRGNYRTYERETQPKRYWASIAWNGLWGIAPLVSVPFAYEDARYASCRNYDDALSPAEQVEACDNALAANPNQDERADLLAARGIAYHNLQQYDRAARDYTAAIKLDPQDSYSLYNRGLVRRQLGDVLGAVLDFDASLRLRPDNEDAYFERGLIYLDHDAFDRAVADFTRAHELDPPDHWNLANRGIAFAFLSEREKAEADFAKVLAVDPSNQVVARGRALLAMQAGDRKGAVDLLTKALQNDPTDVWSLKTRADLYWEMGLNDLARADDDRRADLEFGPEATVVQ